MEGSVLFIFVVFCAVLLCVFTFWVPCCDVRYDFCIQPMLGSSLPPIICGRNHVLFELFVFVYVYGCPTHIVASFSGLSIFDSPSVFSNIYLQAGSEMLLLLFVFWYWYLIFFFSIWWMVHLAMIYYQLCILIFADFADSIIPRIYISNENCFHYI